MLCDESKEREERAEAGTKAMIATGNAKKEELGRVVPVAPSEMGEIG
jgi:hypothetical protein